MTTLSPKELRIKGLNALEQALGTVGTIRFLQHFDKGEGDYTLERKKRISEITIDEIVDSIKKE